VEEAINRGFRVIGFSSHAPTPCHNPWAMKEECVKIYLKTIEDLKKVYKDKIEIYTGLEIDYLNSDRRSIFEKYHLDYQIGSIHLAHDLKNNTYYSIDGSEKEFKKTLMEFFTGDIQRFVYWYYSQVIKMLEQHKPQILGHLDVIKKHNTEKKYFSEDEEWYKYQLHKTLDVVKRNGTIVEVNTGGMVRGFIKETYPSKWVIEECKKRDIQIMVNSDAHAVKDIDGYFELAYSILKEAGYREVTILQNGCWKKEVIK
jgi:histidinol-phosphatase (PHP family)